MLLSEYIKKLQAIFEKHGDLPLIYSNDDEGNEFRPVVYDPGVGNYNCEDREFGDETDGVKHVCIN